MEKKLLILNMNYLRPNLFYVVLNPLYLGIRLNFLPIQPKPYRTQLAGVENPGIIMDHFKTQYISLQALPNQLKFTDLRSIFATS